MRNVTCEGRFSQIHYYYPRLLLIFKGQALNIPFYLINSLQKMAYLFQNNATNRDRSFFIMVCLRFSSTIGCLGLRIIETPLSPVITSGLIKKWPQCRPRTRRKCRIVIPFNPNEELEIFYFYWC